MRASVIHFVKRKVVIPVEGVELEGELVIPKKAKALVIFSQGGGSNQFSIRNQILAEVLRIRGFGTLLFDLLTTGEDEIYENRFDLSQ